MEKMRTLVSNTLVSNKGTICWQHNKNSDDEKECNDDDDSNERDDDRDRDDDDDVCDVDEMMMIEMGTMM